MEKQLLVTEIFPYITWEPIRFVGQLSWIPASVSLEAVINDVPYFEPDRIPTIFDLEGGDYDEPPIGLHPEDAGHPLSWAGVCKLCSPNQEWMPIISQVARYRDRQGSNDYWFRRLKGYLNQDLPPLVKPPAYNFRYNALDFLHYEIPEVGPADISVGQELQMHGKYLEFLEKRLQQLTLQTMRAGTSINAMVLLDTVKRLRDHMNTI